MAETAQQHKKLIEELARDAFKDHVLTTEDHSWVCRKPESSFYWFRVTGLPGGVLLTGDVGVSYLEVSAANSIAWLVDAINSQDYILSKVRATDAQVVRSSDPKKEFFAGDAIRYLDERLKAYADEDAQSSPRARAFAHMKSEVDKLLHAQGDLDWSDWVSLWRAVGVCTDDYAECTSWTSTMLWHYHALKTFVRLFKATL